ncbi:MAG: FAD-dependent oxidoreductase [Xanthomonadales bacterium]|nr:FAD-dependent oxidoreductase [Xanthomonadales bacterium]
MRVVLIGAGHAHLKALAFWRGRQLPFSFQLVDPGRFVYSGMATGVLAGDYRFNEASCDPRSAAEAAGGHLLRDRLVSIDRQAGEVRLESGRRLGFDLLSLNIGSWVGGGQSSRVYPVKPIGDFLGLVKDLDNPDTREEIVVAGGGVTGSEVAACLGWRLKASGIDGRVRLIHPHSEPAPSLPGAARGFLQRALEDRGIEIMQDRVESWHGRSARLASGRELPFTRLVLATGLVPSPVFSNLDLEVTDSGLAVADTLQCADDARIFAAGDCADIGRRGLPNVGVYGVRAATVLADNLEAAALGRALRRYSPQKVFLSILNLGRGEGLAVWARLSFGGRLALRWKDWLDRRFMQEIG